MITLMKTIVGASALLSAGVVTAVDYIDPPVKAASAATKILDRHPAMDGSSTSTRVYAAAGTTMSTTKSDKLTAAGGCAGQTWPYIANECRVGKNGAPVRQATRTVTIEQRVGENTSVLLRLPERMAQR